MLAMMMFTVAINGCSRISYSVCPEYPIPSESVLELLNDLNSSDVDFWMKKQYKLNKKLIECNKY